MDGACIDGVKPCPTVAPAESLVTTRGQGAEYRRLLREIAEAFATTTVVSPDHPCATVLQKCDAHRLSQEVRGYQHWVDGCYTRTTLYQDDKYVIMLLCWNLGVCSPVHAHSDAETKVRSNCFMLCLDGELCETRYEPQMILGPDSVCTDECTTTVLQTGSYAYINDDQGVHKVGNNSASARAVSLHVYAPGWSTVQLYDEVASNTDASGAPFDVDWGDF